MSLARQLARACVLEVPPYTWARPADPEGLLLLDANESSYGQRGRLQEFPLARYPQLWQESLRAALAAYAGVDPANVLATCGADEAIDLLVRTFCEPGEDAITTLVPTYALYARQALVSGVMVRESALALYEAGDAMSAARDLGDSKLTFLCRPNNPSGSMLPRPALEALLQAVPGFLVVDEAYIELSCEPDGLAGLVREQPRLILVRTLSKAFGLAGLRLGYLLADAATIEVVDRVRLPFNVGIVTAELAIEALADREGLREVCAAVRAERERVAARLGELPGVDVMPSEANFLLVHVAGASRLCQALLDEGILVRDRSRVAGVGEALRVTIGTPAENDRFLAAFERAVAGARA
jgi:histidinol-phosphate aminotransferase